MRRRRSRQKGFTLVEMIVATLVLAIGIVACLGAIAVSTKAAGIAKEYSTASVLAERHFSEIKSDPNMLTSGEQSGEFGEEYPGFRWSQSIDQTDITGLLRVSVTIEWSDGVSSRSALFTTYEPQPETTTSGT
jgi:general secretion pathway protein I